MKLTISKVLTDHLFIKKTCPSCLIIHSKGFAASTGWSRAKLVPRDKGASKYKGNYEFDFVAEKPVGINLQKTSEIEAEPYIWLGIPADLKVIRINGQDNFVEIVLD